MQLIPPRVARGHGGVAVTPHELSTQAAIETMNSGGNAVDAAIAANAVQGVVAPETCGIGGDLFALVHRPGDPAPTCLNASGRAGSGASAEALREAGHDEMPLFGPASITVPGCVDGWYALHDRFGSRSLDQLLGPALRIAVAGFAASTELARAWGRNAEQLLTQPSAASMFPGGEAPAVGDRIARPLLADSLRAVLDGRDTFYIDRLAGPVHEVTEGAITPDDMAQSQAEWVEPLAIDLFGRNAWTVPPNSQGYLTLAALAIFLEMDPPTDPSDPVYTHLLIEAYRAVIGERDAVATDPATSLLASDQILDPQRLAALAGDIDPSTTAPRTAGLQGAGGTAYLCTADADGMGVSLIQSNFHGIGSGLSAGDTGVWLHNRGGGFSITPGHPNELGPGRRPLHTLAPTIWTVDGRLDMILGTRGGHQQPQLLAQIAAHRYYAGLELADAQAMPRWTISDIHAADSSVLVEDRLSDDVVTGLSDRGHGVSVEGSWIGGWGPISVIEFLENGVREGVADPRVDTALALVT